MLELIGILVVVFFGLFVVSVCIAGIVLMLKSVQILWEEF